MGSKFAHCVLLTACFVLNFQIGRTADPVLESVTSPDAVGNTVDAGSNIVWKDIPEGEAYTADATYNDGGMGPLFDFARSFINTCFPNGFPYALIEKATSGTLDIAAEAQKIAMDFLGYAVAVVIGLLFIIIFPIIGCCFCCCRCCGNCGGKRIQKNNPSASCKRKVFGVILLALVIMAGVGTVCVFVSNERMTTSLGKLGNTVVDNIDDVLTFLDNTIMQVQHVAVDNFNFTKSVLFRDLDSLGFLVGIPVREALRTQGGVGPAFTSALTLPAVLDTATTDTQTVFDDISTLNTEVATLTTKLADVKNDIDTACGGSTCTGAPSTAGLVVGFDKTLIPDLTTQKNDLDNLKNQNLTSTILAAQGDFESIPEKVQNDTTTTVTNLKTQVDDYSSSVDPMINMTNNLKTQALGGINFEDIKSQVKRYSKLVSDYDKYRWYAGIGLTSVLLLIVLLLFLGLIFGVCGSSASDIPMERGGLSNCGGLLLMAAVGFIFIFSWLFMLLTTLTFLIGAPVERYACQPLKDPEYTVFTKLMDEMNLIGGSTNGSFLGQTLFQDPSVDLTFAGILKDCKAGKAAYSAFKLDNFQNFNITAMTDYRSKLDIDGQLDALSVDLSTVNVLSPDVQSQLNDFTTTVNSIDFTKFNELSKSTVIVNLATLAGDLRTAAALASGSDQTNLNDAAAKLDSIQTGSYASTNAAKASLITSSDTLETTFATIPGQISAVVDSLNSTETFIQTNGSDIVKQKARDFSDRLTATVDSFIADALSGLQNEIGSCTPIYNIYASLIVNGLCRYTIDALNAFWFSLGWAIFFLVPSVIFSVKLAKHYRRMTQLDSFAPTIGGEKGGFAPSVAPNATKQGPLFPNNKVGHADRW